MTTNESQAIPAEVVEAAARAYDPPAFGLTDDGMWEDEEGQENARKRVRNILTAALPHIREQIAHDIEREAFAADDDDLGTEWVNGLRRAEIIARGGAA